MKTFMLQATLIVSIPVKADTSAASVQKLRAAMTSSFANLGTLDDEPILVAVEIKGDLDLIDAVECEAFISPVLPVIKKPSDTAI